MADIFSVVELNPADADKIQRSLEKIKETQSSNSDLESVLSVASAEFNKFFSQYGQPYFTAHLLRTNDTARSSLYNENLTTLSDDLNRVYSLLNSSAKGTLSAFNYSSIVSKEITNKSDIASSKVLDLNILNGFNRGQVIVAGDDFTDTTKIDNSVGVGSTPAELNHGANVMSLKVVGSVSVGGPNVSVSITPVKPIGPDGKVNTTPTPLNLERFYEGKYYSYIGQQEPEGGTLNLKYVVDPSAIPSQTSLTTVNDKTVQGSTEALQEAFKSSNFYAVVPASEQEKQAIRARMFDGDPSTYWQAEYVYATDPLIDPQESKTTDLENNSGNSLTDVSETAQVTIDLKAAEDLARKFDFQGRDLQVNLDLDFGTITPINYVLINPVVAGTSSFIKVLDVATADNVTDFKTVDGFSDQSFDKILTPEANKVLPPDVQAKSLAPSAYSYTGLGVFSFPVRFASKLRITLLVEDPVPAVYERLHLLLQEVSTTTTKTKTKKKGLF